MDKQKVIAIPTWPLWQWIALGLVIASVSYGLFLVLPLDGDDDASAVPATDAMDDWNWVDSGPSPQGTQFMYPDPLPTLYITAADWPPLVETVTSGFSCTEGDVVALDGSRQHMESRFVGDHMYCLTTSSEGAAGSTFTRHEYVIKKDDSSVTRTIFTLRTPQCLNYDEPKQSACQTEQAGFNADALADRIISSVRTE